MKPVNPVSIRSAESAGVQRRLSAQSTGSADRKANKLSDVSGGDFESRSAEHSQSKGKSTYAKLMDKLKGLSPYKMGASFLKGKNGPGNIGAVTLISVKRGAASSNEKASRQTDSNLLVINGQESNVQVGERSHTPAGRFTERGASERGSVEQGRPHVDAIRLPNGSVRLFSGQNSRGLSFNSVATDVRDSERALELPFVPSDVADDLEWDDYSKGLVARNRKDVEEQNDQTRANLEKMAKSNDGYARRLANLVVGGLRSAAGAIGGVFASGAQRLGLSNSQGAGTGGVAATQGGQATPSLNPWQTGAQEAKKQEAKDVLEDVVKQVAKKQEAAEQEAAEFEKKLGDVVKQVAKKQQAAEEAAEQEAAEFKKKLGDVVKQVAKKQQAAEFKKELKDVLKQVAKKQEAKDMLEELLKQKVQKQDDPAEIEKRLENFLFDKEDAVWARLGSTENGHNPR